MKIGILMAGHASPQIAATEGDYDAMFRRLLDARGFTFETYNAVDMEFPSGPEDADGWLISGSRHGVYEEHAFIAPLEALIREIIAADRPLIGVCFGHQIIAQALGGKVEKFADGWSVGPTNYPFGNETLCLSAWHQDQVITLPEGAQTLASTAFCAHAMALYPGKALTIQPHPEFTADVMDQLITLRGKGLVPDPLLAEAQGRLDNPMDHRQAADLFTQFFKTRSLS